MFCLARAIDGQLEQQGRIGQAASPEGQLVVHLTHLLAVDQPLQHVPELQPLLVVDARRRACNSVAQRVT